MCRSPDWQEIFSIGTRVTCALWFFSVLLTAHVQKEGEHALLLTTIENMFVDFITHTHTNIPIYIYIHTQRETHRGRHEHMHTQPVTIFFY